MSEAVVTYIWGDPRPLPYPSAHPEDVVARCATEADDLIARVRAILDEVYAEPIELPGETLAGSTARIAALLAERHPELDGDAVKAVADHFAFNTR
jgi:hypothetical protein